MNALEIRNLVKRFGGLTATNDLSFDLAQGESLGLIGPNGAGKTTVFSQIMGELKQTSGTITFMGQEISNLSTPDRIGLGISRTYQVPRPFSDLSVRENIRVGLMPDSLRAMIFGTIDRKREDEIAASVGFAAADLDRPASELAMGDLRKLEFARTLATGAKVLLLDEVFAGLTSGEIGMIAELIQDLRQRGFTFLMVSHDLPAMEPLIDRAIAIERGTLLANGSFRDVLANAEVRASYLGEA
ncbi:Amino acid/amide ABC transporter ATP-binding protein 1, HAAT family [Sulfitobacter noctilucicola]|uniref:ABC-type branched-subunit amino acid transport system ATPase component n=1 Tax=Sulfitobacter noctilucicola TaxID=1342301 RepID=A0A7W6MCA4_9RHOB|nr:ATP-binding cassette domain-containing protein [Sulfitobacter noctilucicola]KIN70239.1 Amino acid/amide ABC transporter ATP-binding protein 1, HAAT family [Sulfitobacter noctilucicola]MBB4176142.1 ABC-type branched-subunit amino acid transport system ATPase component [Sulfitobacter noctilucicola]